MIGFCSCCRPLGRRGFLAAGGAAGVLALAGCADSPTYNALAASVVTPEQEAQLGLQSFRQIQAQVPALKDPAAQKRVRDIAARIIPASGSAIPFEQWEIVVFDSDEVNAFALPGGHIGVYRGILQLAKDDAEIATVMGHEVGHVNARHAAQRIGNSEIVQRAGAVGEALLGVTDPGTSQTLSALLGVGIQYGVILPYSRAQELQADALGLGYMAKAGYDPQAALRFWQAMAAQGSGSGGFVFASTHPSDAQRIEQLQAKIPAAEAVYRQSTAS